MRPWASSTSPAGLAGELTTETTMLSAVTADLLVHYRGYHVIRHRPGAALVADSPGPD
jgi:hypothetical protein